MMTLRPCIGSSGVRAEPEADVLAAGPIALLASVFLMLSRRRLWYIGGTIRAG